MPRCIGVPGRGTRRFATLSLLSGLLAALAVPAAAEIVQVDNGELRRLAAAGATIVDLRTLGEWRQTGVVAGSQLITLFDENGQADPVAWMQTLDQVAPADRPVVLICRSGNRSGKAAQLLEQRDPRRKIYNVREGINGWLAAGEPVIPVDRNLAREGIRCSPRC